MCPIILYECNQEHFFLILWRFILEKKSRGREAISYQYGDIAIIQAMAWEILPPYAATQALKGIACSKTPR